MLLIIFFLLGCLNREHIKVKGFSKVEGMLPFTLKDESGNFINDLNIKLVNGEEEILAIFKGDGKYLFNLGGEKGKFYITIENKGYVIKGKNFVEIIETNNQKYYKGSNEYIVEREKIKSKKIFFSSNIENLTFELLPKNKTKRKFLLIADSFEVSRLFKEEDLGDYLLILKKDEIVIKRFEASLRAIDNSINIFVDEINKIGEVKFEIDYNIEKQNIFYVEREFNFIFPPKIVEMIDNKLIELSVQAAFDKKNRVFGSKDNVELIEHKFEDNKLLTKFIREGKEDISFCIKLNIKLGIFEFSKNLYLRSFYKDGKINLESLDNCSSFYLELDYAVARFNLKNKENLLKAKNLVIKRDNKPVPFIDKQNIKEVHFTTLAQDNLKLDKEINLLFDIKGFLAQEKVFSFQDSGLYNFDVDFESSLPKFKIIEDHKENNYKYKISVTFDKSKRYSCLLLLKIKEQDKFIAYKDFYLNEYEVAISLNESLIGKGYEEKDNKLKLYLLIKEDFLENSIFYTISQTIIALEDKIIKYFGTFDDKVFFDFEAKSVKAKIDPDNIVSLDSMTFLKGINDKFLVNLLNKAILNISYNINKIYFYLLCKEKKESTYREIANTRIKIIKGKNGEEFIYDEVEGLIKRKPIYHFNWLDDERLKDFISKIKEYDEKISLKICVDCLADRTCKEFSLDNSIDIFYNNKKVDIQNIKYLDNFSTRILELEEQLFPIVSSQTFNLKMSYEKSTNGYLKKEDEFCSEILKDSKGDETLILRENNVMVSEKNGTFGQSFKQEISLDDYLLECSRNIAFNGVIFCLSNMEDETRTKHAKILNGAVAFLGTSYLIYSHFNPDLLGNYDKKSWGSNFKLLGKDDKSNILLDNYMNEKAIQYDYSNVWQMYVYIPEDINLEKNEISEKYFPNSSLLTSGNAKLRVIRALRELDNSLIYRVEETKAPYYKRKNDGKCKTTKGWKLFVLREDKKGVAKSNSYNSENSGWAIFTNIPFKIFRHSSQKLDRVSNKTINLQSNAIDN